jgi:thiamine biosynthesis lipoprotein ApbE
VAIYGFGASATKVWLESRCQSAQAKYDNALPEQVLNLNNQAIAFSGKGYRDLARQSHLIDPKTGLPCNM